MAPTCQSELQTATCQPTASTKGQQWLLSPHSDVVQAASRLHPPPLSCLRSKQACAVVFRGGVSNFLQPTGFQTSKQDSSSQYWTAGLGCPICGSDRLLPRRLSHPMIVPCPSLSPPRYVAPKLIASSLFLTNSLQIFVYSLGCRRAFLPVSFVFSVNCLLHM